MSERTFRRWDRTQIRQHQVTMVATFLLIATGLPLRFAQQRGTQVAVGLIGGASVAAFLHRLGAVLLVCSCLWHFVYLLRRLRGAQLRGSMLPVWKDVTDAVDSIKWVTGLRDREPYWGRYNYIEKFEYWAVLWGSFVMIFSGLCLWFPVPASRLITGMGIELCKVVHGYEALLAALSILIWHMYHAHLRADVFPMNRVWLTGTLTEEEMRHHHPAELDRILREEAEAAQRQAELAAARVEAARAAAAEGDEPDVPPDIVQGD